MPQSNTQLLLYIYLCVYRRILQFSKDTISCHNPRAALLTYDDNRWTIVVDRLLSCVVFFVARLEKPARWCARRRRNPEKALELPRPQTTDFGVCCELISDEPHECAFPSRWTWRPRRQRKVSHRHGDRKLCTRRKSCKILRSNCHCRRYRRRDALGSRGCCCCCPTHHSSGRCRASTASQTAQRFHPI